MLRGMRERLDEIHAMVEAPIVNTQTPYFEVPVHAHYIWDNYRRAEKEVKSGRRVESRGWSWFKARWLPGSPTPHFGRGVPLC